MPTDEKREHIASTIAQLRAAEQCLEDTIAHTGDETELQKLAAQCRAVNELIDSLVRAQLIADDAAFIQVTKDLKTQAADLKAQEGRLRALIHDVDTAAKVVGYITQALTFITAL